MRFLLISFSVISVLVLGFVLIRALALHRPFPKDPSRFFFRSFEVVAHRGGSLEAPENTLAAFIKAAKISPEIVFELDIHMTKDGELVVIHDDTVDRTTDGRGLVQDKTLKELKDLDAGYSFQDEGGQFSYRAKGVQIPTLREVFEALPERRLVIEVKSDVRDIETKLVAVVKDFGAKDRVMIGSQVNSVLTRVRKLQSQWNYCAGYDEVLRVIMLLGVYLEPVATMAANAYMIPEKDGRIEVFSTRLRDEVHRRGKKVLIWTVNTEEDMRRLIAQGVDGLVTDRPSLLYKVSKGL